MQARSSQYIPGGEIPEKSWAYRLAKKIAFHEYGVYTRHFRPENWRDPRPSPAGEQLVQIETF